MRVPLQPGWAWLDKKDQSVDHYREELSPSKAMEWFVRDMTDCPNSFDDYQTFKSYVNKLEETAKLVNSTVSNPISNVVPIREHLDASSADESILSIFGFIPSGLNASDWLSGRQYYDEGLTGPGQRAHAIFCLSHYLFYGDPERCIQALGYGCEQERDWAIQTNPGREKPRTKQRLESRPLRRYRPGYKSRQLEPPHKRGEEIPKYKKTVSIAWIRHNANLKADARKRIADAVTAFAETKQPFTTRELEEKAGCSMSTLYQHKDIWKAIHQELSGARLAAVSDEYNAVEGAGCPKTEPPSTAFAEPMPPGRLAARRIVFELTRRGQQAENKRQEDIQNIFSECRFDWKAKVVSLIPPQPELCSMQELKAQLVVLQKYLAISPDYENQEWLRTQMHNLREVLSRHEENWSNGIGSSTPGSNSELPSSPQ